MTFSLPDHDETDIWTIPLDTELDDISALESLLDSKELERYNKLHPRHKHRYLISHAACRNILEKYTSIPAEKIVFITNNFGKPGIKQTPPVYFNLSHSHDMAALAISSHSNIGIDIEYLKKKPSWLKLARRFFSNDEVNFLQSQPETRQLTQFFQIWTRKEAYIKAIGTGLNTPLSSFTVVSGDTVHPLHPTPSTTSWYQQDLDLPLLYKGTVVQDTPIKKIRYYSYQ